MPQEDEVAFIRDGYDAINRGDLDALAQMSAPDFEVVSSGLFLDAGAVYRGSAAAQRFIDGLREAFENLEYVIDDIRPGPDGRYLVRVHLRGRGKASGIDTDTPMHHVVTLRDGKVVRLEAIADEQAARAAAGIAG